VPRSIRRKKEDNLAGIFMGFIIVFLVCHLPRLLLNIHELATIRKERGSNNEQNNAQADSAHT
jgi:hypothetical protein